MSGRLEKVEQLRAWRGGPASSRSIGDDVARLQSQIERSGRRLGEFISLWESLVPAELAGRTRVQGFRGGVAHVIVESSPALYQLDRLLRGGMEAELRRQLKATLVRVRLSTGPLDDPAFEESA